MMKESWNIKERYFDRHVYKARGFELASQWKKYRNVNEKNIKTLNFGIWFQIR